MGHFVWLLPIIFIFHDFEEIIMQKSWKVKYQSLLESSQVRPFEYWPSAEAGTVAVFIEFGVLVLLTIVSLYANQLMLWYGALFVFTCHLLIHFAATIKLKIYTPGVMTSLLLFPICVYILYVTRPFIEMDNHFLLILLLVFLLIFIVLFRGLIRLMPVFSHWLTKYENNQSKHL